MTTCHIASIQMTSNHDVTENLLQAKKLIQEAVQQGAQLIVLPEMFAIMGLDQMDKVKHREEFGRGIIQDFLREQALTHQIWVVGGTIPLAVPDDHNKVYAACLVWNVEGTCVARYDKIHLFDVNLQAGKEIYAESKTTAPGHQVVVVPTPFGKIGLAVCYDVRFPELFRLMHQQGVEIIVLPAAFTYTTGSLHWDVLVRARAIENLAYVVTACQTGTHANQRKTFGHSMIVNPWGEVLAMLPEDEGVVTAKIDLSWLQEKRRDFPVLTHRKI